MFECDVILIDTFLFVVYPAQKAILIDLSKIFMAELKVFEVSLKFGKNDKNNRQRN